MHRSMRESHAKDHSITKQPQTESGSLPMRAELVRRNAAIEPSIGSKIDIDIQARLLEAKWAELYVPQRPTLIEILDKLGINEKDWCRKLGRGFSYSTVMRRIQVLKGLRSLSPAAPRSGDNFRHKMRAYLARPEKPEL